MVADDPIRPLREQVAGSPLVELVGVVDPRGARLSRFRGYVRWTLRVRLDHWRIDGGEVRASPLTLVRDVDDAERHAWQAPLNAYAVLRFRARLRDDASEALLDEIVGEAADAALVAHAEKLRQPVTHEDPLFGILTLDRRINRYDGAAVWNGRPVRLSIKAPSDGDLGAALRAAHLLWQDQAGWNTRILDSAAARLLPIKNESWLDEGEAELTADEFRDKMELQSVSVNADGSFEFWHGDGDLFWGHAIVVNGDLAGGLRDANIEG